MNVLLVKDFAVYSLTVSRDSFLGREEKGKDFLGLSSTQAIPGSGHLQVPTIEMTIIASAIANTNHSKALKFRILASSSTSSRRIAYSFI
jgi:hypothetical protein